MTTATRWALIGLALVLLLVLGGWYYLFGPNRVDAAELVPSDTVAFAMIPNAAELMTGYQMSRLRQVVEAPDAKPIFDSLSHWIGAKNLDLLQSFLPNLSGQSFIALTHFDPGNLSKIGLIAGFKPKPGAGDFNAFVEKLKAAYPFVLAQGKTGTGQVEGLDYQWIQGPGAPDRICVAQIHGWVVTSWGEDTLRDWWERLEGKGANPSLAKNPQYQKSLERVGRNSEAFLYVDYQAFLKLMEVRAERGPVASLSPFHYLAQKWQAMGAGAVGTRFEDGDIEDRFSLLMPRQAQIAAGMQSEPCAFETLKFTSPYTRFYLGSSANWAQGWKNLEEQANQNPPVNPMAAAWVASLQQWAQGNHLDFQHNILDALGNEVSLQVEWDPDSSYPDAGFFVKLDHPDDFKPVEAALVETLRKEFETSAEVDEINSNGQKFATLKFVRNLPISPTMTEDGPYFGLFLTANQAVRSFVRDARGGLPANADFNRQIGDKRDGAKEIIFMDSPWLADRTYQIIKPVLLMAQMLNPKVGAILQGRTLPADLHWLAPIDTWSVVMSSDDDGIRGYSVSGIGNQGIFLAGGLGGTAGVLQVMGRSMGLKAPAWTKSSLGSPVPAPAPAPIPAGAPVPAAVPPASAPIPAVTNVTPAAAPADSSSTNAPSSDSSK